MHRTQTMVQLTDQLIRLLDEKAARSGVSRSALVRQILSEYLQSDAETMIGKQIVAGYERIPPATPDEWGDLTAMTDTGNLDVLQRLDVEERSQGHPPW